MRQHTSGEDSNVETSQGSDNNQGDNQHRPLGLFIDSNMCTIHTQAHANALLGLLQVANGHANEVAAALGHNNQSRWINHNIESFFQEGGPFQEFQPIGAAYFQRQLKQAENLAREICQRDHSNGPGGDHEDPSNWARSFFPLFEILNSQPYQNERSMNVHAERNRVVARQAPLGSWDPGSGPVELQTETSQNTGDTEIRSQVFGRVDVDCIDMQEGRNGF